MSGQTKQHTFVLVIKAKRGFRTEYQVKFNDHLLKGSVVKTRRKGKEVWITSFGTKSVDRYDPQWLCRRNNRSVKVPLDHPSMWGVRQAQADQQEAA